MREPLEREAILDTVQSLACRMHAPPIVDVLVVDDDVELALTVRDVLEVHGHEVRIATNGAEGLTAIAERMPDVLLLDIEMPVLDGPSMARQLVVIDRGNELIPIVLSSGYGEIEDVALRIGTPYRVPKPCSAAVLLGALEQAHRERRPPQPPIGSHRARR